MQSRSKFKAVVHSLFRSFVQIGGDMQWRAEVKTIMWKILRGIIEVSKYCSQQLWEKKRKMIHTWFTVLNISANGFLRSGCLFREALTTEKRKLQGKYVLAIFASEWPFFSPFHSPLTYLSAEYWVLPELQRWPLDFSLPQAEECVIHVVLLRYHFKHLFSKATAVNGRKQRRVTAFTVQQYANLSAPGAFSPSCREGCFYRFALSIRSSRHQNVVFTLKWHQCEGSSILENLKRLW